MTWRRARAGGRARRRTRRRRKRYERKRRRRRVNLYPSRLFDRRVLSSAHRDISCRAQLLLKYQCGSFVPTWRARIVMMALLLLLRPLPHNSGRQRLPISSCTCTIARGRRHRRRRRARPTSRRVCPQRSGVVARLVNFGARPENSLGGSAGQSRADAAVIKSAIPFPN